MLAMGSVYTVGDLRTLAFRYIERLMSFLVAKPAERTTSSPRN